MTQPITVVLAPDKFKGSLTASEVADALSAGLRAARTDVAVVTVPVADGGDGTLAVALSGGYRPFEVSASDALGRPRDATLARLGDHALIELASICGLQDLPADGLQPERCTTLGLGQAMKAALDAGCRTITVGLGGSASTDGGAGLLCGLGARILDDAGRQLQPNPTELRRAERLDLSDLDPRLSAADIEVAVDVDAPLLGPGGAAAVFGPQKGADSETVDRLESVMRRWARVLSEAIPDLDPEQAGSGAAGGTAFGARAVGARIANGAEALLDLAGFDAAISSADLVITGEGRLDRQTLMGKAPAVVARRSRDAGVPCIAVVGSQATDVGEVSLRHHGFGAVHELVAIDPAAVTDPEVSASALTTIGSRIAHHDLPATQPTATH